MLAVMPVKSGLRSYGGLLMVKDYLTYVLSELNRGNKDYASLIPSKVVLK